MGADIVEAREARRELAKIKVRDFVEIDTRGHDPGMAAVQEFVAIAIEEGADWVALDHSIGTWLLRTTK